jgi:hypothetical protein
MIKMAAYMIKSHFLVVVPELVGLFNVFILFYKTGGQIYNG